MSYQPTSPGQTPASTNPTSQKDYAAAFGALQSRYGMGGFHPGLQVKSTVTAPLSPAPSKDSNSRKWYKRGSTPSSSTASLLSSHSSTGLTPHASKGSSSASAGSQWQEKARESEARLGELMAEHGHGSGSRPPHRT